MTTVSPDLVWSKQEWSLADLSEQYGITIEQADEITNKIAKQFNERMIELGWETLGYLVDGLLPKNECKKCGEELIPLNHPEYETYGDERACFEYPTRCIICCDCGSH